ncbi:MAG TPA: rhodanese-like domain-containing protein [Fibrobacteria bacterium]|nr:rhodanese-like domain-containing protein [Fibrobacteria bacterium]HOX49842.1 rhodanese-like domain-containing protein [Fibrobacteria bacterium]
MVKTHLSRLAALLLGSLALAAGINALRESPLPLIRPSRTELALRSGITPIHLDTAALFAKDPRFLFLDARHPSVFRRAHIPGSTNFFDMEFAERIKAFRDSVPLDRPLVVYCDGAECRSSEILAQALAKEGYTYVYLFFGGWIEWVAANQPVEKAEKPAAKPDSTKRDSARKDSSP